MQARALHGRKRPQTASAADAGSKICPCFFLYQGNFAVTGFASILGAALSMGPPLALWSRLL